MPRAAGWKSTPHAPARPVPRERRARAPPFRGALAGVGRVHRLAKKHFF
jgi:hypothetical protein